MKVYVLLTGWPYEGSDIIRICSDKKDAEDRLAFLVENRGRFDTMASGDELSVMWSRDYIGFPGQFFEMQEWEVMP